MSFFGNQNGATLQLTMDDITASVFDNCDDDFASNQIFGGVNDDHLYGLIGNDEIRGGDGNDYIYGDEGNDKVHGDEGDDQLLGGSGADRLDGGNGSDQAAYSTSLAGVTISLDGSVGIGGDATGDILINIENLSGSNYDDVLTGDSNSNIIDALQGNDQIIAGAGNDFLYGREGDDVINGDDGNDFIEGGVGNDLLFGNTGNDKLFGGPGADQLDGGVDIDDAIYLSSSSGVIIGLDGNAGTGGDAEGDVLTNIENLTGSYYDDVLNGDTNQNLILGQRGDDRIFGGEESDGLYGGAGNDEIQGGGGNDYIVGGAGNDQLFGGVGDDYLVGEQGDDTYTVSIGDDASLIIEDTSVEGGLDTVVFGAGITEQDLWFHHKDNDLYIYIINTDDYVRITDWFSVGHLVERFQSIDGMVLLESDVQMLVDAMATINPISGQVLTIDQSILDEVADEILVSWHRDGEQIFAGAGNDYLYGGVGFDEIHGGDGNDYIEGRENNDQLFGDAGSDQLLGGSGADLLNGGAGTDRAIYSSSPAGVVVYLDGTVGVGGDAEGDTLINIENLTGSIYDDVLVGNVNRNIVYGLQGNDQIFGDEDNDELYGGEGNDVINGGDGNDYIQVNEGDDQLFGDAGSDQLLGGSGADLLDGGAGTDRAIYSSSPAGVVVYLDGTVGVGGDAEGDTLINIENLTGSIYDDVLVGNVNRNIVYGLQGNDQIFGDEDNDELYGGEGNDVINGGDGNDYLLGIKGNDIYHFSIGDGADLIREDESAEGGTDTIQFGSGIDERDLWFNRKAGDLYIYIIGTDDFVRILDWFSTGHLVERFQVTGGAVLLESDVQVLVDAMAVVNPASRQVLTIDKNTLNDIADEIAASWNTIL